MHRASAAACGEGSAEKQGEEGAPRKESITPRAGKRVGSRTVPKQVLEAGQQRN